MIPHYLQQLVQIPSVNPSGRAPDEPRMGEARLAAYLAEQLTRLGGRVEVAEVLPQRPNVYAYFAGQTAELVAVDVHMDTVDVGQMTDPPFDGRLENGRVWGRGAVDTKATLAILLALLEKWQAAGQKPRPNLLIVGTISEEFGGNGALAFADYARQNQLNISQLIVAEPTLCGPIYAHKGVMGLSFRVHGRAAHSSTPEQGQNAITAAARIALAIEQEHQRLQAIPATTALGPAVVSTTMIEGGVGHNVIPDSCLISVNRRLTAFEEVDATADHLEAIARAASPLPLSVEMRLGLPALYQSPDAPLVRQLAEWSGVAAAVAPYGTNALCYSGLARETVVFGPGSIDQAHKAQEWVEVAELEKAAEIYARWLGE